MLGYRTREEHKGSHARAGVGRQKERGGTQLSEPQV